MSETRKATFVKKWMVAALVTGALAVQSANAQEIDRAQEYRMWSAEQMINRLTEKFARSLNGCNRADVKVWMPNLSDACKASVLSAVPILNVVHDVAASGDPVRWAELIDKIHTFEASIEGPLNTLEGK